MRSKVLVVGLMVALVAVFCFSTVAMAQQKAAGGAKLLCVSKQELKGEETVASCLAKGERFAVMDPYGIVDPDPGRGRADYVFNLRPLRPAFGMK
jgi:hypothetical protein